MYRSVVIPLALVLCAVIAVLGGPFIAAATGFVIAIASVLYTESKSNE